MYSVSKGRRECEEGEAGYMNIWQKRRSSQSRIFGTSDIVPSAQGNAILT